MSRSYWLLIASIVGLAQPVGYRCHAQTGASQGKAEPQQAPQVIVRPDLAPLNERLERIDKSIEGLQPKPETADEYRRAEGDLNAQEKMAVWAEWMFYATAASVVVSALGVGLIILTLRQNKKAMGIAITAADAANRAAEVERGFVFVRPEFHVGRFAPVRKPSSTIGEPAPDQHRTRGWARYRIRNLGRTPVIVWSIQRELSTLSKPQELDNTQVLAVRDFPGGHILESGDDWAGDENFDTQTFSGEDWDTRIATGDVFFWFGGTVFYEDVHGIARFTRFRWVYNGLTNGFAPYGGKPHNERT